MTFHFAELFGVAAAAAGLYAAYAKTIIPLRIAAITANFLAMIYSLSHGTYPTFMLNAVLLPLNGWRLWAMLTFLRVAEYNALARSLIAPLMRSPRSSVLNVMP